LTELPPSLHRLSCIGHSLTRALSLSHTHRYPGARYYGGNEFIDQVRLRERERVWLEGHTPS
jgi:glycine/serine hydroxymethyltransferase